MSRSLVFGFALLLLLAGSCSKQKAAWPKSEVYVKYSEEPQYITIETVNAGRDKGSLSLLAEGFDHELLKIYLPDATKPGVNTHISAQNISFSDGLDFESREVVEGFVTIKSVSEEAVTGDFKVLLLDNVNGVERRWVEGSFRVLPE